MIKNAIQGDGSTWLHSSTQGRRMILVARKTKIGIITPLKLNIPIPKYIEIPSTKTELINLVRQYRSYNHL